jgi:hypothetical protein
MQRSIGLGFAIGAGLWFYASRTRMDQLLLLGSGFLWVLKTGVGTSRELVLELFDTTRRVDELQLSGVERMANIAYVDLQLFASAPRFEAVAAAASDLSFEVFGVDAVFHDRSRRGGKGWSGYNPEHRTLYRMIA